MKKRLCNQLWIVSALTILGSTLLIACGAPSGNALSEMEIPLYFHSVDNEASIKLYFADESKEVPYFDIDTAVSLIERVNHEIIEDKNYALTTSAQGSVVTITRENQYPMQIDCDKDTISFYDFDAFFVPSWTSTIIDVLQPDSAFEGLILSEENSYSRFGSGVVFDLKKYGIDLIEENGKCYIPMQTLSDIMLSLPSYVCLLYNNEGVFVYEYGSEPGRELLRKYYAAQPKESKSEGLADYTYNELCMMMDHFYGLKESHGIEDFDEFFTETALRDALRSTDPEMSARAMRVLMDLYIDDLHSGYMLNSWRIGMDAQIDGMTGKSIQNMSDSAMKYYTAREKYYPDGIPGYEEVGNTAYITFDSFQAKDKNADYYKDAPTADTKDTVGLLLYSYSQITRKGSPVENVVIDLSMNSGGDTVTASFMISLFLGEGSVCIQDTLTGAYANECFRADANLDGVYDEKDSLLNYNLYCITSSISFSCGNLVPSVLKSSGQVTILGQQSGGGACTVIPFSTADGTLLQMSSNRRLSYMKNGSVYDIDQGVEPDYMIHQPEHFYDREALTEYINNLY